MMGGKVGSSGGGLGEEQREGLRGVDTDTSVGEVLGGEGSVGGKEPQARF